ncbi:hypothetical protein FHS14_002997 [Paenibacillus baekrokdamisoli]|uniref:hypothetical protein n=1 Tax=Paenibacillus baekrokdamisoli TaxID=1712516 RepID=UPI000F78F6EF|nr:hypothetical protein [Paenibacillus baekrokdamisoli]MBB3070002.1 hypothetical protein [Paenibacillus baekrokdamisoli]
MDNNPPFVMVVIPLSTIKKFIIIDLLAGTAIFHMLKMPLHSFLAASAGSMVGTILIKQSLKLLRKR